MIDDLLCVVNDRIATEKGGHSAREYGAGWDLNLRNLKAEGLERCHIWDKTC